MKFSEEFAGRYLKAADIQDVQPIVVTITNVDLEEVESRDKKEKRAVHMAKVLADTYGDQMDDWQGQLVELVVREQEYGGDTYDVIRFRIPKAQKKAEAS